MRVTVSDIEDRIKGEEYIFLKDLYPNQPDLHRFTICILTLDNGYVEFGQSSCVDIKNFDPEEGKKWARKQAFDKLWAPIGFELRTKLVGLGEESKT
jgi:hypothetical protein